jgi:hypothetical protein
MQRYDALLKASNYNEKELLQAAKVEMTGVLINEDKLVTAAKNQKIADETGHSADYLKRENKPSRTKVVKYKKICSKYELDVVMNRAVDASIPTDDTAQLLGPKDEEKCVTWTIVPITKQIKGTNLFVNKGTTQSLLADIQKIHAKFELATDLFTKKCVQKFSLVLNYRGKVPRATQDDVKCEKFIAKAEKYLPQEV